MSMEWLRGARRGGRGSGVAIGLIAALVAFMPISADADSPAVDFSRDVLPILSNNCFACHGPDADARKADLRLDRKESALRAEEPIIEPGKSAESELIRRLTTEDPDERMPPAKFVKKLTPQ